MPAKVLVVAPGRETRGGITAVILAYEKSFLWEKWNCVWIETYIDKSADFKILYFLRSFIRFIFSLPGAGIVHIHLSSSTSAIRKSFYFYLAYLLGKKTILHLHVFSSNSTIIGKYKSVYRNMFRKSNRLIVLSSYWKKEVMNAFGENIVDIEVLLNPCVNLAVSNFQKSGRKQTILYAGTLNKRKGYADLIMAFSRVANKFPGWELILAGNGEIEEGIALSDRLGINDRVVFSGWVSGNEKDKLFREASIFCLPSYAEGFPMAVLDAISYGIPLITTPVGGMAEILVNKENTLMFNPGDIDELTEHLEAMISDEDLRNRLSSASLDLSRGPFSIDAVSTQLDSIYTEILL
jgi:glycosyltransferase involved in cell wall biosynthesis